MAFLAASHRRWRPEFPAYLKRVSGCCLGGRPPWGWLKTHPQARRRNAPENPRVLEARAAEDGAAFLRRRRRWERDIARCSEATHCGAGEEARRTDQRHGTWSGEGPFAEECKQSRQVASQLTSVRKQLCAARRDAKTKRAQLLRDRERKNLPPKRDSLRSDERYQAMVRPAHELCVPGLGHSA